MSASSFGTVGMEWWWLWACPLTTALEHGSVGNAANDGPNHEEGFSFRRPVSFEATYSPYGTASTGCRVETP